MKEIQTPIPWQVAKNKIEVYTTAKWKQKWIAAPHTNTQTSIMTHPTEINQNTYSKWVHTCSAFYGPGVSLCLPHEDTGHP